MHDLTDARALTLRQPWAHAVAHHGKTVENRTWMPPANVDTLFIHAGKSWDKIVRAVLRDLGVDLPAVPSAIVAVADLAFTCDTSWDGEITCGCGPWALPRHCHWVLINVRALGTPVPATGRQGLWRPTAEVLTAVREQLAVKP